MPSKEGAVDDRRGLPDGTGDADYLAAVADVLPRALDDFGPELILFQGGGSAWRGQARPAGAD